MSSRTCQTIQLRAGTGERTSEARRGRTLALIRVAMCVVGPAPGIDALAQSMPPQTIQRVTVSAGRSAADAPGSWADMNGFATGRSSSEIDFGDMPEAAALRLEDLTGLVPGAVAEPMNAGLSTSIKLRGFAISRLHYAGMPDVQRMFSRDLITVDRIEVLSGPAAAALGITSPGGAIHYLGKRPTATPNATFALQAGSQRDVRATLDASGPLGAPGSGLRYRAVGAAEDGERDWASLPRRRQTAMLALERVYAGGSVGIDVQTQRNVTPFSFGTVITNGGPAGTPPSAARIAWDRLLVLDGGAPAQRYYRQAVAQWQHAFDSGLHVHASLGAARVRRSETLIGYWTLTSADEVSTYYTQYEDRYRQRSGRLELRLPLQARRWLHELRLGIDGYRQDFLFEGVQYIGAPYTPISSPDFGSLNPALLQLYPRYNDERIAERGAWVADRARLGDSLDLSAAVRRQRYAIESDRAGTGRVRVADAAATTWFVGADWSLAPGWRSWASHATGMEPNRGATSKGEFLPAQTSRQLELGLEWRSNQARISGALWQIELDNVAMTDPSDRTAVIAAGNRRVEGLEARGAWRLARWEARANATVQKSRHLVKTSRNLGDQFVGVPRATGALRIEGPVALQSLPGSTLAVMLTAVGSRMGDSANTVRVPGYVRVDAHLTVPWQNANWFIGVQNAGDIRYVESVTAVDDVFQGARRRVWVGLTLKN